MGKVKLAVKCVRHPLRPGEWVVQEPYQYVAIKQLDKYCILNGVTVKGHRVQENPLQEVGVLLHLSGVGVPPSSSSTNPPSSSSSHSSTGSSASTVSSLSTRTDPNASYPRNGGHPNVLNIYDLCEDNDRVYIVLEYLSGGELFTALESHQINEAKARTYFSQLVQGIQYCHLSGVAHRDVSLENTLLSTGNALDNEAKVIDFGLAVRIPSSIMQYHRHKARLPGNATLPSNCLLPSDGRIGKERYMPPEIFTVQQYDPISVDTWELGVSLFLLLFGVYPYKLAHKDACPYFKAIADGQLIPLLKEWGFHNLVSYEAIELVNLLLQTNPFNRISLEGILQHPWLTGINAPKVNNNHNNVSSNDSNSSSNNNNNANIPNGDMVIEETIANDRNSSSNQAVAAQSIPNHHHQQYTILSSTTTSSVHQSTNHTVTTATVRTTIVTDEIMDV